MIFDELSNTSFRFTKKMAMQNKNMTGHRRWQTIRTEHR